MRVHFKLRNSFGEIYHVLAAVYLLQEPGKEGISVDFANSPYASEFEEFFDFLQVPVTKSLSNNADPLPTTANHILERFYTGCLNSLAEKIRDKARENEWRLPDSRLATSRLKLLIWQRNREDYDQYRNSSPEFLRQLVKVCERHETIPVILGGPPPALAGAIELGNFYEDAFFKENKIAKELWFIDELFRSHGAIASVGMMSGAMDGPAMVFGHKTVFLAKHKDATPRMQKVSMAFPNLIWQPIEYQGNFQKLTDFQQRELEQKLW